MGNDPAPEYSEGLYIQDILYFDVPKADFGISELIDHLRGLEHIAGRLPSLMVKLLPDAGVSITGGKVFLDELKRDSLKEDIESFFTLLGDKAKVERYKKIIMENKALMTVILGGVVAAFAFKSCVGGGGSVPLISNRDGIVQLFAKNNITIVTPESYMSALDDESKRSAASGIEAAVNFLRPAKKRGGGVFFGGKGSDVAISADEMKNVPEAYERPEPAVKIEALENVEIQFRAHDVDKTEQGWGAVIPDVHPSKRLKLELEPDIDREKLLSRSRIKGDVEVYYKINQSGKSPFKAVLTGADLSGSN